MPDPAISRNTYSVLVAGSMNPMLHHPQWYRTLGVIDDEELAAALRDGLTGTTPFGSRFQFGTLPLIVTCLPVQWSIQSSSSESWERMIRIAAAVFAPTNNPSIRAYGLVSNRHIDADTDVKSSLAAKISGLRLGFPRGENVNTNVTLSNIEKDHTIVTSVQNSVIGERTVFVSYHVDRPSQTIEGITDGGLEHFIHESEKFFSRVTGALNDSSAFREHQDE